MDAHRAHMILPTNATSAANPLASTTPTAIARDTVIQTNREGEPPEYREIKTTETIIQPTLLEAGPPLNIPTHTIKTTTTTVEEVPIVSVPTTTTTTKTTVVEDVPTSADYVIRSAGSFKPVLVTTDVTPTQTVETIVTEPGTKKVTKTTETIETVK
jgi:hypothetical protein